jgi:hypothetical protein
MSTALLDAPAFTPPSVHGPEQYIFEHLAEQAVIGLNTLVEMLPQYSWNQIFLAVDNLARVGRIVLRRHRFEYTLFSANYAA